MYSTTTSDFRPTAPEDETLEIHTDQEIIEVSKGDMQSLLILQECREFARHYGISFYYKEGRRQQTAHRVEFRQSTQTVSDVGSDLAVVADEAMKLAQEKFNLPNNFSPSYTRVMG